MCIIWLYIAISIILVVVLKKLLRLPTVGKYGGRYVFLTGCDTGFGNLLAKRLDSLGFHVFAGCLSERGADELRKVSSARLRTLSLDVTKTDSVEQARMFIEKHLPSKTGLWAVVNNAGVLGPIAASELLSKEDYQRCLSVNLLGMIDVTRVCLPLVRRERGRVVNMSSVAGRLSFTFPPYPISKYGVEAFSDCLRREVLHQGITVHIIEPSAFRTHITNYDNEIRMTENAYARSSEEVKKYYGKGYAKQVKAMMTGFKETIASPHIFKVVDAYCHALTAVFPRYRYLVGSDTWYWRLVWNLPEWLSDPLLAKGLPVPEGGVHTRR